VARHAVARGWDGSFQGTDVADITKLFLYKENPSTVMIADIRPGRPAPVRLDPEGPTGPRQGGTTLYEVTITRSFSAAHTLRDIGGKCESLHGHNFRVEVTVSGESLDEEGLLVDFRLLKRVTEETLEAIDHRHLNELAMFAEMNPSSERLAKWIHDRIAEEISSERVRVSRVVVWESDDARATYSGGTDGRPS